METKAATQGTAVHDDPSVAAVNGEIALRDAGQRAAQGNRHRASRREDRWIKCNGVASHRRLQGPAQGAGAAIGGTGHYQKLCLERLNL